MSIRIEKGPEVITYQLPNEEEGDAEIDATCCSCIQVPLQNLAVLLRNSFYLPLYNKQIDPSHQLDHKLADKISSALMQSDVICPDSLERFKHYFSVRDMDVCIQGTIIRTFTVRLFESKMPIAGKNLRVILFSFYGNEEVQGGNCRQWEPLTIGALSQAPFDVLRALKISGLLVQSMVTTSLGNVVFDGLKHASKDILPKDLIINRGLTSIQKVANQLYRSPINYLLYNAARLTGWDANPEQELINFLESEATDLGRSVPERKVVIIEALKDFYFSREGAFEPDFHERLNNIGVQVCRLSLYPFPFHVRSHHAISWEHLVLNSVTEVHKNTIPLSIEEGNEEKLAAVLARDIFLSGPDEWHNCFYVGGNDATLDVGTAREVVPLLSEIIEEGERMGRRHDDAQHLFA